MISGERVRQARELRALTQSDLAHQLGVTQSAVAQIETGRTQPTEVLLEGIAATTGFPAAFFEQGPPPEFPLGSLLYRARADVSARTKVAAQRKAQLLFELHQRMAARLRPRPHRLQRLTDDAESAARLTRAALGLSPDTPIANVLNAIERAGVLVMALPLKLNDCDAFSAWVTGGPRVPVIALSSGVPGDRIRYTASHELGHLVLHEAASSNVPEIEREAHRFAGEFLLPEEAMRRELLPPVTLGTLASLKLRWGVSLQALIMRARHLGVITERQSHYLFEQIARKGWREREPTNLDIPVEKPRALRKMAEVLYGIPVDLRRLAEDMRLPVEAVGQAMAAHATRDDLARTGPARNGQPGRVVELRQRTAGVTRSASPSS